MLWRWISAYLADHAVELLALALAIAALFQTSSLNADAAAREVLSARISACYTMASLLKRDETTGPETDLGVPASNTAERMDKATNLGRALALLFQSSLSADELLMQMREVAGRMAFSVIDVVEWSTDGSPPKGYENQVC